MTTKKQQKKDVLQPKMFNFPLHWWRSIQQLSIEEQKVFCFNLVAYIFDHISPDIQFDDVNEVWYNIAKEIEKNQKKAQKRASGRLEKEQIIEKEDTLSALSLEEKEIVKEKERCAQQFYLKLQTEYPNVAAMEVSLSFDEYLKLLTKWPLSLIRIILAQMNKWKNLQTQISAYKTCNQWLKGEKKALVEQRRWDKYEEIVGDQKKAVAKYLPKNSLRSMERSKAS